MATRRGWGDGWEREEEAEGGQELGEKRGVPGRGTQQLPGAAAL